MVVLTGFNLSDMYSNQDMDLLFHDIWEFEFGFMCWYGLLLFESLWLLFKEHFLSVKQI